MTVHHPNGFNGNNLNYSLTADYWSAGNSVAKIAKLTSSNTGTIASLF
jgi:hypothetical protein